MHWFAAEGELAYSQPEEGKGWNATGDATSDYHLYQLQPFSTYLVELAGGVHSFGNVIIESYHPHDLPKQKVPDPSAPPDTAKWVGMPPKKKMSIGKAEPFYTLDTADQFHGFHKTATEQLKRYVDEGAELRPEDKNYIQRFIGDLRELNPDLTQQEGSITIAAPTNTRSV